MGLLNFIFIARKRIKKINAVYSSEGRLLERVDNIKYLGVTISKDLKWNTHVSNVCTKANRTHGFLRRNLSSCPQDVKETAYKGLVRPIMEYASPIWDPHGIVVQEELEKVQNRAARFGNYNFETGSMTSIIEQLGWESLHKRRNGSKLILLFKGLKGRASIPCDDLQPQIGAVGISIQWHFKCHMLELTFTNTVSFQTPLGIGMHSLQL